jgi:hypothetical protein
LEKLRELKLKNEKTNIFSTKNNRLESPLHNFYPKVVNKTNIVLTKDEMMLLNRGLQYNLHCKNKDWFKKLALEADIFS